MTLPSRRFGLISHVLPAALIFIGILIVIIAVAADWLGISYPGFGLGQIVLAAAGIGMLLMAFALRVKVVQRQARRFMHSKVALILVGLLVGLVCVEIGSRVLEKVEFPKTGEEMESLVQPVADPRLGFRLAPYAGGHDANGFRNDTIPDQVDIVAIGDSQTWGINARRSQTWPQTLARLSGHSTYNMGLGYYGPVQYWVLTEDALKLAPKVIVIGLYLGNDIWGAYQTVYPSGLYPQFRHSSAAADLLNDTIASHAKALSDEKLEFQTQFKPSDPLEWRKFTDLFKISATVRLLDRYGWWPRNTNTYIYLQHKAWAQAFPNYGVVYEKDNVRTVLTTGYRLLALDMDETRIAEGLRITKEMLLLIHAETEAANVALLILLIPTKETVYADAVDTAQGALDETYARLVQMEAQARIEIVTLCEEGDIEYADALPVLAAAVQRNEQIYPPTSDGHPNPWGYSLLASSVNEALSRFGWLEGD